MIADHEVAVRVNLHQAPGRLVESVALGDTRGLAPRNRVRFLEPQPEKDLGEGPRSLGSDQQIEVGFTPHRSIEGLVALEMAVRDLGLVEGSGERNHERQRVGAVRRIGERSGRRVGSLHSMEPVSSECS